LLSGWRGTQSELSEAVSALLTGNRLTLDHLEDALRARGVSVIECEGRPFEPERMSAVDLVETGDVPEGFVVEVYRPGYEWNGSVFRPAQVKVARRPAGGTA
jgi:molecular chaperone GrpE